MGLFDKVLGRTAPASSDAPEARSLEVALARPFINTPALTASGLRTGMWVMTPNGVGILTGCRIDGLGEVTLSKPDGSTMMVLDADDKAVPAVVVRELVQIDQASIEDIPESRRGDVERLRAMGYKNRTPA